MTENHLRELVAITKEIRDQLAQAKTTESALQEPEEAMSDEERHNWSRHYDALTWGIVGIVLAGLGALLMRSFDCETPIWTNLAGIVLSIVGAYFIACFRRFRHQIHNNFKNAEMRKHFQDQGKLNPFSTWRVLVLTFMVIDTLFLYGLWRAFSSENCILLFTIPFACIIVLFVCLASLGSGPPRNST